ncbi:hypothetical protein HYDPIDRAFT_31442 [Hydnomerulius pinastri MD-312]|uniref:Unplaced genomic scaffold scaffold_29, whole genome shotgun sequence n=1 Tax=Hydnomerulius pinastri MD-312 TaxID=994086 RepID=A0A0C9W4G8_9AGAM|nr:hypothetical protein HYDPIDRAFT_31442 [Hydnomerulius pinastri MD-312]
MSYAKVAAHNAPPSSQQPHPDPALLNTEHGSVDSVADDIAKVNIVPSDFKQRPATYTSEAYVPEDTEGELISPGKKGPKGSRSRRFQEAEAEGAYLWEVTKQYLFRPGVAGGLIGIVNVGLLSGAGYALYTKPHLRRDTTIVSSAVGGALLLLGTEGYAAEKYRKTPRGREEERRAREEGSLIYKHLREQILRPVNTGIIGTVGYYSYLNWDKPRWNRDIVTAASVGLLALWGGEGYLAERYRESHRR